MRSVIRIKEEIQPKRSKTIIHVKPIYSTDGVDLMFKGKDFYAIYLEDKHLWSMDQQDFIELIDKKLDEYCQKKVEEGKFIPVSEGYFLTTNAEEVVIDYVKYSNTGQLGALSKWMNTVPRNFRYNALDTEITSKDDLENLDWHDFRSKTLKYSIKKGPIKAYNRLMSVLYSKENREKLEWAIGSVFVGDSKKNDKMIVIYGEPGTGKSTVLRIIKGLFDGYWSVFVASALANKNNLFATASFKDNPLVAIQDDGTMSKIDDPRINELISHSEMEINEKGVKQYTIRPNAILFMATNEPVDIHDTDEGIVRRLLDVHPTRNLIPQDEYFELEEQVQFELGAIAYHCINVYKKLGRKYYAHYIPAEMIQRTNYTYNFMRDNALTLASQEKIRLIDLYKMYRTYFEDCGLKFPLDRIKFGKQAEAYFESVTKPYNNSVAGCELVGFKINMFEMYEKQRNDEEHISWLTFNSTDSLFDEKFADRQAQYATKDEKPKLPWKSVRTKLKDIDTTKLHYVNLDKNEIVIDFDLEDEDGNKNFEMNFEEARQWPETYAELSKSGKGIHLHYIYTGDDVLDLADHFDDKIEIKVFKGNSSLRRKLTLCNAIPVAEIDGTNLPRKERKKKGDGNDMLNKQAYQSEKELRDFIERCMKKTHHGATKPEVDYIKSELDKFYESGKHYDISDMKNRIVKFAMGSTHQADKAVKVVNQMHFMSDDASINIDDANRTIIFFDVEVFPNLFLLNWKYQGDDQKVTRMINPDPEDVERLVLQYNLIGFNNRRYDNHILYAWMQGYTNEGLYKLSQKIINEKGRNAFFGEAYNLSYTDVYDFLNGDHKKGLKKWEIELGIHHQELGLPWDQPVPEEMWEQVAEYCDNDVIATEAVFNACPADWTARQILADISGLTVNDTTNSHTMQIIFGADKHPQSSFIYTDLSEDFPGYTFDPMRKPKSLYRDEDPGEGGYVYAEPGIYYNVALLDIASMHPTSLEQLNLFGPYYTKKFSEIKQARIYIKHKEYEEAGELFDGKLKKYLNNKDAAKDLANALKIAINSVYGLTSASFENRCRDPRNVDNIVAKRGALFMINLKHEVQERGYTVAHIKTDSIKIPDATPEIINFVMEYGQKFGYTFEHEATYSQMCLVNNAVYIAKYAGEEHETFLSTGEKISTAWTATGAEFQHPYILKKLFTGHEIKFRDLCETKTVINGNLYLDMNEDLEEDEHAYDFVGKAGSFCPIASGKGGGELVVLRNDKYVSATGAKGWRWLEAETVQTLGKEDDVDYEYFDKLAKDAIDHINEFGSFENFVNGDKENFGIPINADSEVPFEAMEPVDNFMNKPE